MHTALAPSPRVQSPARVPLPTAYNYIGAFLTFRCPYRCSYCINHFSASRVRQYRELAGRDWLAFFERLAPGDVPITLQGGEPGAHPDFIAIVKETSRWHHVDLLTNLAFDLDRFIREIDPGRINRDAPYAPIRVSYHPEQFSLAHIISRMQTLASAGFRVGLYGVTHPAQLDLIEEARQTCSRLGLDFRTKPFLGWHADRLYGDYQYPEACAGGPPRQCECAPSELLVAPDGSIHRCHGHLYGHRDPLAHIADPDLRLGDAHLPCADFGQCHPCDIKVKNNRFQQFGHVAMRIRNIR